MRMRTRYDVSRKHVRTVRTYVHTINATILEMQAEETKKRQGEKIRKLQNTVSLWQRTGETVKPKSSIASPEVDRASLK